MYLQQCTLVLLFCCIGSQCARILGIFNTPSISHQIVFQPIWKELSLRGHEVVVMTPNPLKDPKLVNLTEIDLGFLYDNIGDVEQELATGMDHWTMLRTVTPYIVHQSEMVFSQSEVLKLIKDNETTFDVVVVEAIFPIEAAFAAKYNCPLVGIASLTVTNHLHQVVGTPSHPVLYPDIVATYGDPMTFMEKVDAVLYDIWARYFHYYEFLPALDEVIKKYFGNEMPNLVELEKNMSLLLLNTNPALHKPRALGPNVIEMGGRIHIKPKKPLPQELKEFLDNSTEGVVYFSLGSNVKSKYLPEDKRRIILEVFSELPCKVLWKFEKDDLAGKPDNVKISKWLPQQDMLDHPNIKLFITQGGLQSLEEAIVRGTPLLAIPFIADQYANAAKIKALGIGLNLNFATLTKESFKSAILEILNNSSYKENVVKLGKTLNDEPMTGVEKAVWWIEYVIRNRGAPHLRSSTVDTSWYEFLLLDVCFFLTAILIATFYVIFKAIRLAILFVYGFKKIKTN